MSRSWTLQALRRVFGTRETSMTWKRVRARCLSHQLPIQRHTRCLAPINWQYTEPRWAHRISRKLHGFQQEVTSLVEQYLADGSVVNEEVKGRQIWLLSALLSDMSEPTDTLVTKLNLTSKEVYTLAVAVFRAKDNVEGDVSQMAAALFQHAGQQGDMNALYTYAQLLRTGQGTETDLARAAELFSQLAMKGHPYAQFALAGMYYAGSGVEQNFTRAYSLYKVASQNYVAEAFNILGSMYQHGQGVTENMEKAVANYTRGAELGDPLAHMSLASCYTHSKGVAQSYEQAFQHHLKASEAGLPVALYNVGGHYFTGKGVEHSFKRAAEYYQRAADLGFGPAQVNLGNMYYNGLGVERSRQRARELYQLAANSDDNARLLLEELEQEMKGEDDDTSKS